MRNISSRFFSHSLSCAAIGTRRFLLLAGLLRRNTLRLSMLALFALVFSATAWGETIGIETTLGTSKDAPGTESIVSATNLTVEKVLGSKTTVLAQYDNGDKVMYHGGSTEYYAKPCYKWATSATAFDTAVYVGYKVTVGSRYKYSLTSLDMDLAVGANFSWRVLILSNTGDTLYATESLTITKYKETGTTNYTLSASLSDEGGLQNLTGEFYVKTFVYFNSSPKYLCFPKMLVGGTLSPSETPYTFHYGEKGGSGYAILDFHRVGTTNEWQINNFVFPDVNTNQACYVGYNDSWYNDNLGSSGQSKSADLYFVDMPLANLQGSGCTAKTLGWEKSTTNGHKAIGTLRIYEDYSDDNLYVGFIPNGYGLMYGVSGSTWATYPFKYISEHTWITEVVSLTAEMVGGTYSYHVGLLTSDNGYTFCGNSETAVMNTIGTYVNGGWKSDVSSYSEGQKGVFRIWDNSCNNNNTKNFVCHFVPYYHIIYNANYPAEASGQPADTESEDCSAESSKTLTLPDAPTAPAGYKFKGWTAAQDGFGTILSPNGTYDLNQPESNVTLYAQWEKLYTVTYALNGGSGDAPTQEALCAGATFTVASADGITKDGYTFAGWNDGTTTYAAGDTYTMSAADVTLTAVWNALPTYTVTYALGEGATGTAPTETDKYEGEKFNLASADGITKDGYTFAGWNDGTTTYAAGDTYTMSAADVTLTAQWKKVHTITYNANEGECGTASATCTDGESVILPTPTRTGYTFKGWYTAATDGTLVGAAGDSYTPAADITLYAQWEKQEGVSIVIFNGAAGADEANTSTKGTNYSTSEDHSDATTGFQWKLSGQKDALVDVSTYTPTGTYSKAIRQGGSDSKYNIMFVVPDGYTLTLNIAYAASSEKYFGLNKGEALQANGSNCSEWNVKIAAKETIYEVEKSDLSAGTYYLQGAGDACCFAYIKATINKSCNSAGLSFPQAEYSVELGETFTTPTLTQTTTATATYSSSNTSVATVDANTGEVSLVGAGTTTITASTPAEGDYCEGEASYELTVTLPDCETPSITTQPTSATYCAGETITNLTIEASVSDGGALSYQWQKDGADISGATEATYTPTEAGTYTCVVTNTLADHTPASTTSDEAVITINAATAITTQPASKTVSVDEKATLTVEATGTGTLTYQWYTCDADGSNPQTIGDATADSYSVTPATAGTTYYKVTVTGTCGSATSDVVAVTANAESTPCFSMEITATGGTVSGQSELTDYATITGGTVLCDNSADMSFTSDGLRFGSSSDYLKVTLSEGVVLAKGTEITMTYKVGNDRGIKILKSDKSTEICRVIQTTGGTYTETITVDEEVSENVFYITRVEGTAYLQSIELSGCGKECISPGLAWPETSAEGVVGEAFSSPPLTNPNTLSVTYSSSDEDVATIDEEGTVTIVGVGTTTISATYAGDGDYCEQTVTYTLTVHCAVAPLIQPGKSVINGCNEQIELKAVRSDNGDEYDSGSFQWYRNGAAISGATEATYTATTIGTYTVEYVSSADCREMSTNSAVITSPVPQPEVTRLTPFHYYRNGCDYTGNNDNPLRHLFKVVSRGTADGGTWKPFARKISGSEQTYLENVTKWITAKNDTVLLDMQVLANLNSESSFLSEGDTVVISVRPVDACNVYSEAAADSIRLIVKGKDTRSVAYIVSGGNGNTITYGGDFLTGYNPSDLLAMSGYSSSGGASWSTDPDSLWHAIDTCKQYTATAVNGYAPFNKYNYEPFDLVLLTDFPKTDKKVDGQTGAPYLNDLAELVDSKPFLSLKAHMAKDGMDKWKALGFVATPLAPVTTQTMLDLVCSQHTIFNRVKGEILTPNATESDGLLTLLSDGGYDQKKGLQGFLKENMTGFMNIATIPYRSGSSDTLLVACCERQNNLDARLMVLSVNAQAMSKLTPTGCNTILSMMDYLLINDYAEVQDCGCIFDNKGGTGTGKWSEADNWDTGKLPTRSSTVHIHADCEVDDLEAVAGELKIWADKKLTINANAALQVSNRIGYCDKQNTLAIDRITSASTILIKADDGGAGTLVHSGTSEWEVPATVQYYSKASGAPTNCQWQWMTIPIHDMGKAENYFYGAWIYEWSNETHGWTTLLRNEDSMRPFGGYSFTQETQESGGATYTIAGNLVHAQDTTIALHYDAETATDGMGKFNLIGNSWTAPINIAGFQEGDFTNCEATIIMFNTGLDPNGTGDVITGENNTTAGQYVSVPIFTESELPEAIQVIPAMQAFQVNATAEGASVKLRYNSLVRTSEVNRQPMRAAARNGYGGGITERLHILVDGERFSDQVYLFRNDECTNGFDNGWDGTKMLGDERAVQLFVEQDLSQFAVSTQPSFDGTRLGFYRGEDDTYTIRFEYDGAETLYLYDSETDCYTPVDNTSTYSFSSQTYDLEHRFLITSNAPESPSGPTTGIVAISADEDKAIFTNTSGERLRVAVYDAAGRLCAQYDSDAPLWDILLPETQGVYLIEAKTTQHQHTRKVVR
ncbi:MAG: InlB B-repeat-containing protein [Paludibacteraceae bacterium]